MAQFIKSFLLYDKTLFGNYKKESLRPYQSDSFIKI